MNNRLKKFTILFGDFVFLYLALYLALSLRYLSLPSAATWQDHFFPFTAIFFGWIIIFYISGLYDLKAAVNGSEFIRKITQSLSVAALLSVIFFYASPGMGIAPKTNLIIFIFIYGIIFVLWRRACNWLLKSRLPKTSLAFAGLNRQASELIAYLIKKPHLGYDVKFIVEGKNSADANQAGENMAETADEKGFKLVFPPIIRISELKNMAEKNKISALIFSENPRESGELRTALFSCLPLNIKYQSLANFYEQLTGKVPVEAISEMWFLENMNEGKKNGFDLFKRVYDIILAFAILVLTLAFWPLIALAIKMESQGPVFIRMPRSGKNGAEFGMLKFRSMREIGNDRSPTLPGDRRITGFGSFLRKTRLDEIPQALNILRGDMSFVGPRPERPELILELEKQIPFYRERMLVKPGITGWDQISGEYHSPSYEDSLKKLQYDLFYIKNRSLYLDLSIILKTIATVVSREGR
ncbi:MAG: sugar transferase [Patescibacteria group bacterium]|jgi:exopolysaccharide biosynthesis polyprenyl glycosylphosphotransferase